MRKQYVVLKSSGMNTSEMNEDYENIVNIVEDNREVAWADQTMTSDDTEVQPLDAIKNAENNLSLLRTSTGNYVHYYRMIITSFIFVQVDTPNELLVSRASSPFGGASGRGYEFTKDNINSPIILPLDSLP